MVIGFLDIVCDHIFEWKHPFNIEVSSPGDQILFICIFTSQLKSNQMTPVVQIFAVHTVIFHGMPAGWLYLANTSAFLRRHDILAHTGVGHAASSQII